MSEPHPTFTFLLGSGVSRAAGLRDVRSLSGVVASALTGEEATLLKEIRSLCAETHGDDRHTYEDWYFVADQICEHESDDLENPGLLPLMEQLRRTLGASDQQILGMAERLCPVIVKTVCSALSLAHAHPNTAFVGLADAIRQHEKAKYRFFSLNHDLVLECFLKQAGITAYFSRDLHPESTAYQRVYLSREAFDAAAVSVVKLHGSVNWRAFRPQYPDEMPDPFKGEFIGIRTREDRKFELIDDVPRILMGTFNKVFRYSTPVFLPLFAEFQRSLRNSSCLVVCGYGFSDKGINTLVNDWMCSATRPRMLVVDPQPFDESRCRRAISRKVATWESDGRLKVEPCGVGVGPKDVSWTQILKITDDYR